MSNLIVRLDSLLTKVDNIYEFCYKSAQSRESLPLFQARAAPATAKWRRDKSIEKINWDKYGEEIRSEYAAIKNILLQGYNLRSRKINDPTSLNQFFLRHKEFIVKHWKILTDFDKGN